MTPDTIGAAPGELSCECDGVSESTVDVSSRVPSRGAER